MVKKRGRGLWKYGKDRMEGTTSINLDHTHPYLLDLHFPDDEIPTALDRLPNHQMLLDAPMSDVEARLVKMLKWEHYKFQLITHPKFHRHMKKVRLYNPAINGFAMIPHLDHHVYHMKDIVGNDYALRQRMEVRWSEYQKTIGFPRDFKDQFPYLYWILRDQYLTNLINRRNLTKTTKYYEAIKNLLAKLVARFWNFYRVITQIPGVIAYFQQPENKDYLTDVKELENLIESLVYLKDALYKRKISK